MPDTLILCVSSSFLQSVTGEEGHDEAFLARGGIILAELTSATVVTL